MNRKFQQPAALSPELFRGIALQMDAMATAKTADEILLRLEEHGVFLRVDPTVAPTMLRGAIISDSELTLLRRIEDVVRMGRVRRITRREIVMEGGSVPTDEHTLHVHCAARALADPPTRPIFEPGRIHVQGIGWGFICLLRIRTQRARATMNSRRNGNSVWPSARGGYARFTRAP
jgi:hypothetical protein